MKKHTLILSSLFILINMVSCSSNKTKNTIGFMYYLDDNNLTCSVGARVGFNLENAYIGNSYIANNGKEYKIVSINSNQKGEDNRILKDFLSGNKYIKSFTLENDYISTFPWDIFRSSTLTTCDLSKATNLKVFGDHVFTSSKLKSISLPPVLERTYNGVFSNTLLKEVSFPSTYVDMGIDTFFDCKYIEKVDFSTSLTYLSGSCFERTPSLKEVIAPSLKEINQHALRETPMLKSVPLDNVNYIGYMAFYKTGLEEVSLKDAFIETMAFNESKIKKVTLNNVSSIPYKAFGNCKDLKEVSLLGRVEKIGSNAFVNSKIETLVLPDSVSFIGSEAFYNNKNLKNVTLSASLEAISTNAFKNCSSLTEIVFPNNLKRIYDGAFLKTGLKEVNISNNVSLTGDCFPAKCKINRF